MKISKAVRKETGHIALGVALGSIVMVAVFALLHRFDYTVVLGALLGGAVSILNFLFMGLTAQKVVDSGDEAQGKALVHRSYSMRMLLMAVVLIVGFAAPCFHVVAVAIPFLLPRITILVMQLLGMYQPQKEGGEKT